MTTKQKIKQLFKEGFGPILVAVLSMGRDILIMLLAGFFFTLLMQYGVVTGFCTNDQVYLMTKGAGFFLGTWILTFILIAVWDAIWGITGDDDDQGEDEKPLQHPAPTA